MPAHSAPLNQEAAQLFGPNGATNESGTTARTGDFFLIDCLTDTVLAAISENGLDANSDSLVGVTLPAGTKLSNALGIKSFTLTSGTVRAYNR